jgi:hypothetical protein
MAKMMVVFKTSSHGFDGTRHHITAAAARNVTGEQQIAGSR